jgi:hypothetical protein
MEDRYFASMQRQWDDDDDFGFAPQCYKRYEQLRCYKQTGYEQPRQSHYNRGWIVDYIDHEPVVAQLCQLLQAAPMAHALAPPALFPPALAQVHQVQPPAAQRLNLGTNAATPWFSSTDPILKLLYKIISWQTMPKMCKSQEQFQSLDIQIRFYKIPQSRMASSLTYQVLPRSRWFSDISCFTLLVLMITRWQKEMI